MVLFASSVAQPALSKLPIDEDDVGMIFEDVYLGRSVIPPHLVPSRPALTRWILTQPLTPENCVVMEYADAEKHVKECSNPTIHPRDIWGEDVNALVERRSEEVARQRAWVVSY